MKCHLCPKVLGAKWREPSRYHPRCERCGRIPYVPPATIRRLKAKAKEAKERAENRRGKYGIDH